MSAGPGAHHAVTPRLREWLGSAARRVRSALPEGRQLPPDVWVFGAALTGQRFRKKTGVSLSTAFGLAG